LSQFGTFGFGTIGGSNFIIKDEINGTRFFCPEKCEIVKLVVALRSTTPNTTGRIKLVIYSDLYDLVAETEQRTLTLPTTPAWYNFKFSSTPLLEKKKWYYLCIRGSGTRHRCMAESNTQYITKWCLLAYGLPTPNPWVPTSSGNWRLSIYCNYKKHKKSGHRVSRYGPKHPHSSN